MALRIELNPLIGEYVYTRDHPVTAQTNAQRQEALRAKREMLGLTEVRGIYLPPELHAELKKYAKSLAQKRCPPMRIGP